VPADCQFNRMRLDAPSRGTVRQDASNVSIRLASRVLKVATAIMLLAVSASTVEAQSGGIPRGRSVTDQQHFAIDAPAPVAAPAQAPELQMPFGMNPDQMLSPEGLTPTLKIMVLMTLLSLAPSILIMTTSFIRFVIVFGLLRQALGTQQLPPTQVITSLSLFMTMFVMMPVWQQAYDEGLAPYIDKQPIANLQPGENVQMRVFENTIQPLRRFMIHQISAANGDDVVLMLVDYRRPDPATSAGRAWKEPENLEDVESSILVTAFMLTELKAAFLIGFQIFLPFLIVDLVVATILTGMGMMMLPPTLISLPFKVLLFVLIDGWTLTVAMLLESVTAATG
jgi:flagellar biosynthesis protein FliP